MSGSNEHRCAENNTRNEVWYAAEWMPVPMLTLVGSTSTSHFEHNERIFFCPYCGKDLREGDNDA